MGAPSGAPVLVARVLVDSPLPQLDQLFDYRVPPALVAEVIAGMRVRVPLRSGGRIATGWIVELADTSEFAGRLSDLEGIVSSAPLLAPDVWLLARKLADRAAGNASDILRVAIPSRYVRVEKAWLEARQAGGGAAADASSVDEIAEPIVPAAGSFAESIEPGRRLALTPRPRLVELASGTWVGGWAVDLAEAAAATLATGRTSLLCVPDYRDQEQLEAALSEAVPAGAIARLDARQPGGRRFADFLRCLDGEPLVVIGNRSVLYAPAERLGLIAVWDDGDALLAEPHAPGVHARDIALVRQEQSGAALVFAAHSPSVEVERLVRVGWLDVVALQRTERPRIVVTAGQPGDVSHARIPSSTWTDAREALAHGPVLIQVAHPGFAPLLACATCGENARCTRCAGPLGLGSRGGVPRCRLCGALAADWSCGECHGTAIRPASVGAGRTAEDLGRAFPGTRVIISDGERPVLRVGPEPALVVATRGAEPIAEGGYRAVLLLDGERMLLRESLRVAEDCLRWWSNAATLAAPGAPVHLVGVSGRIATALATWRQAEWARDELDARRALRFPPAVRIATIRGRWTSLPEALEAVAELGDGVDVLGPVPEDDGIERAIVRFDYARGAEVATTLRAAMIRVATRRRRPVAGQPPRPAPTLRVRFDDQEIL
ncbi:primosomal protein N' [Agromyces atrinae]|uniref:primosomal protein N' family DNA-binding protein n=1 Tax=Agromyces atrinae TaxID=592376 RepID=UPI001F5A77BC|nr:primosomal protein N' [Agromyces atrinae]MCI2958511.1 primosomal protein N' [Agromyces atrinae]